MTTTTATRAGSARRATPSTVEQLADFADTRLGAGMMVKLLGRKVFPRHWSFELGAITLHSFIVLLLTGVFLTFWYVPSQGLVEYDGPYAPLQGILVSEAYASTVDLSWAVRGGLLMRQIHHWAALIFVASTVVHMCRVFFTGAFRKPREVNWVIGVVLALLAIIEGFAGYSLPDDLLSGTGLRIAAAIILALPVVGSYMSFFVFGGQFPGEAFIPRLYTVHVLLIPGIFLALIAVHLFLVVYHKHTQFPGGGRTETNVVGEPALPAYAAKIGGLFFVVFGVVAFMAAFLEINPIWAYGPYDPSPITAGSQPDWYMGFLDGAVRSTPGFFEITLGPYTLSLNILVPALVIPGIMTVVLVAYPWIEQWVTGDRREHHIADRPRNAPTRTALGVMGLTFYIVLWANGGNDILAHQMRLSINDITNLTRVLLFVAPPIAFVVTKRICLGLQRRDRERVLHGRETGQIYRLDSGEVLERHEPLAEQQRWLLVQHDTFLPIEPGPLTDANGVHRRGARWDGLRHRMSSFYFGDAVPAVTPYELAQAQAHDVGHALAAASNGHALPAGANGGDPGTGSIGDGGASREGSTAVTG